MDELIQAILNLPKLSALERQEVSQALVVFLQQLAAIWFETLKIEITADDLLPLIAELLPKDNNILQLVLTRIEEAVNIEKEGIRSAALTNFYSAVYFQLHKSELIANTENYDESCLDKTILVANEVCWQTDLVKLKKFCVTYKDSLLSESKDRPDNETLKRKYFTLIDMLYTLKNKKQPRLYRLLIFTEKFDHFQTVFKKVETDAFKLFLKDFSHTLGIDKLAKPTPEEAFLNLAGEIVKKIKNENLAKPQPDMTNESPHQTSITF